MAFETGVALGADGLELDVRLSRDGVVVVHHDASLDDAALDVVRRAGAVERVCFGAFGRRVLRAVRTAEPALATSASREEVRWALYRSWCGWPHHRPAYTGFQVPEWSGRTRVVSRRFVNAAHQAGLGVQV